MNGVCILMREIQKEGGKRMKKILALLILSFVMSGLYAQELYWAESESMRGGADNEISYKASFGSQSVSAKRFYDGSGFLWLGSYNSHFEMDGYDWFLGVAYKNDSFANYEALDWKVGAGLVLFETGIIKEKVSIAAIIRNGKYVTSIRNKITGGIGDLTYKDIFFYYPEVSESTHELKAEYKINENFSIFYRIYGVASTAAPNFFKSNGFKWTF